MVFSLVVSCDLFTAIALPVFIVLAIFAGTLAKDHRNGIPFAKTVADEEDI